jgi:hypothetical protein
MLDLAGIMFSSIMMLIVMLRAVQYDRIRPWFETSPPPAAKNAANPGGRGDARPPDGIRRQWKARVGR